MSVDQTGPGEQWRELKEYYSRLSEDSLWAAADEAYDLTDMARSVLGDEIRSRGLKIQLREAYQPPQGDLDPADLEPELVVLRQVWSEDEAQRVKEILDAAFVRSYLGPGNVERVDDLGARYEDGVDIKVWAVDRERGLWVLRNPHRAYPIGFADRVLGRPLLPIEELLPQDAEAEPQREYQAACPRCKSPDIVFCGLDGEPQIDGSVARSPFSWRCDACGNQWKDDGMEESRSSGSGS